MARSLPQQARIEAARFFRVAHSCRVHALRETRATHSLNVSHRKWHFAPGMRETKRDIRHSAALGMSALPLRTSSRLKRLNLAAVWRRVAHMAKKAAVVFPSAPRIMRRAADLSEPILAEARRGIYPATITKEVSPERLRRFFPWRTSGNFQNSRSMRDTCTFATQNICVDPPFSRLDLVSCRNMLLDLGQKLGCAFGGTPNRAREMPTLPGITA